VSVEKLQRRVVSLAATRFQTALARCLCVVEAPVRVAELSAQLIRSPDPWSGSFVLEPSVFAYAERHDNLETIYKKLQERRDTADVTELVKELQRIANEAIRAQVPSAGALAA